MSNNNNAELLPPLAKLRRERRWQARARLQRGWRWKACEVVVPKTIQSEAG